MDPLKNVIFILSLSFHIRIAWRLLQVIQACVFPGGKIFLSVWNIGSEIFEIIYLF